MIHLSIYDNFHFHSIFLQDSYNKRNYNDLNNFISRTSDYHWQWSKNDYFHDADEKSTFCFRSFNILSPYLSRDRILSSSEGGTTEYSLKSFLTQLITSWNDEFFPLIVDHWLMLIVYLLWGFIRQPFSGSQEVSVLFYNLTSNHELVQR